MIKSFIIVSQIDLKEIPLTIEWLGVFFLERQKPHVVRLFGL